MKPWKPNNAKQSQPIVEQGRMVQVMYPSQKFEPCPFSSGLRYEIKNYRIKVPLNGIT
jgi:hypothetical protein